MEHEIKIGDCVDVQWENVRYLFHATVMYVPVATGDCWHLMTDEGNVVYVQHFARMDRVAKD